MIYYIILLVLLIFTLYLEKLDHNCSLNSSSFYGFLNSECAKINKIESSDTLEQSFHKLFECQDIAYKFVTWRQFFISALLSSFLALIIFKRPWNDDWFVFVLTFIIFFVFFVVGNFYQYHFVNDRFNLLKNNTIEIKRKIKHQLVENFKT
jgi:hypothetical protein